MSFHCADGQAENPLSGGTKRDRTELLRLLQDRWEALESCRIRAEELADAGLPVHSLIPMRLRLTSESLAIVTELRRMEAEELLKQNTAVAQFTGQVPCEKDDFKFVTDTVKELDRTTILAALCLHNWDAVELCDIAEQELADKGLPAHALFLAKTRLIAKLVEILTEWRRSDAQLRFKQLCSDEGLSSEARSDAAKFAKEILKGFSPKHRKVLRQILDRG
jgi:hypothetical protein